MTQGRLSTGSKHCGVFLWWRQVFSLTDGSRVSLEKPVDFVRQKVTERQTHSEQRGTLSINGVLAPMRRGEWGSDDHLLYICPGFFGFLSLH